MPSGVELRPHHAIDHRIISVIYCYLLLFYDLSDYFWVLIFFVMEPSRIGMQLKFHSNRYFYFINVYANLLISPFRMDFLSRFITEFKEISIKSVSNYVHQCLGGGASLQNWCRFLKGFMLNFGLGIQRLDYPFSHF